MIEFRASRLAIVGTIAVLVAACGGGTAPSSGGTSPSTPPAAQSSNPSAAVGDGPANLVIAVREHFAPGMKTLAEEYRKTNDNVAIEIQSLPNAEAEFTQRIVTAHLGGQEADIIEHLDTYVDEFAANGVTTDLLPYFAKKQDLTAEDFLPQFLDQYRPLDKPDQVHGMPVSADATVVFFNKDLFAEAGVAEPAGDWTWQDMTTAAKKITVAGQGKYWGMAPGDLWQAVYNPMIKAYGGFVYDKDKKVSGIGEPAAIEAWTQLLTPMIDGSFAPYDIVRGQAAPQFPAGQVAMMIGVRAHTPGFRDGLKAAWDVVTMPTANGQPVVGGGSYGLAITEASKSKDAAFKFLAWFYRTDGGMKTLQETYQVMPPTADGVDNGLWRNLPAPPANTAAFATDVKVAVLSTHLPGRAQAVLADAVTEATEKVLLNGVSIEEAFGEAQKKVNDALTSN